LNHNSDGQAASISALAKPFLLALAEIGLYPVFGTRKQNGMNTSGAIA